jgi:hypothetical protein
VGLQTSRANFSLKPGTLVKEAAGKLLDTLGEGLGLDTTKAKAKLEQVLTERPELQQFLKGKTLTGLASDQLEALLKSKGLSWSVQDGQFQILRADETTQDLAVVLSPATGLVGNPEIGEKGIVKGRSLLIGKIFPGRRIQINSRSVEGFFKAQKVVHFGDTWGNDWNTEFEAKPI